MSHYKSIFYKLMLLFCRLYTSKQKWHVYIKFVFCLWRCIFIKMINLYYLQVWRSLAENETFHSQLYVLLWNVISNILLLHTNHPLFHVLITSTIHIAAHTSINKTLWCFSHIFQNSTGPVFTNRYWVQEQTWTQVRQLSPHHIIKSNRAARIKLCMCT